MTPGPVRQLVARVLLFPVYILVFLPAIVWIYWLAYGSQRLRDMLKGRRGPDYDIGWWAFWRR